MKQFSSKLKYFTFTFVFIMAGFMFSQQAFALPVDIIKYKCDPNSGGGMVFVDIKVDPSGPFPTNTPTPFTATASITSTCSSRMMRIKAQNNDLLDKPIKILLDDTMISPGIGLPYEKNFTSPSNKGDYAVAFTLGVDEPSSGGGGVIGNSYTFTTGTWNSTTQVGTVCGGPTIVLYVTPPLQDGDDALNARLYDDKFLLNPYSKAGYLQGVWQGIIYDVNSQGQIYGKEPVQC